MPADETTLLQGDAVVAETMVYVETAQDIADNWKKILIVGILNVAMGILCLMFPAFATHVTQLYLVAVVFVIGLLNVMSVCMASSTPEASINYQGHPLFWLGMFQILLAIVMWIDPFFTLTLLTFLIALIFMILGSIQIAVARKHRATMAARALMMISGVVTVLTSIIIILAMDSARWITIGILVGVNFINIGFNRIVVGLYGRKIAEAEDATVESWRSYLDADIV